MLLALNPVKDQRTMLRNKMKKMRKYTPEEEKQFIEMCLNPAIPIPKKMAATSIDVIVGKNVPVVSTITLKKHAISNNFLLFSIF